MGLRDVDKMWEALWLQAWTTEEVRGSHYSALCVLHAKLQMVSS